MDKSTRAGLALLLAFAGLGVLVGVPAGAQAPAPAPAPAPPPAATVNAAVITVPEVTEPLTDEFAGLQLKRLIDRELVRQEAQQLGLKVTDQDVAEYVARIGGHGSMVLAAGRAGLSVDAYEHELRHAAVLETLFESFREKHLLRAAKAHFDALGGSIGTGPRVHVYEIVCTDIKQAYLALERIKGGEPFPIVASELSIRNSESGGDAGWLHPDDYHLGADLARMAVGEIGGPILQGGEYFVIYKAEFVADRPADFEEVRSQLVTEMATKPTMQFDADDYLELLARRAQIRVTYQPLAYLNQYYAELEHIRVLVDGRDLPLPSPPFRVKSGQTLIPVKPVLQQLDAALTWNAEQMTLTVQRKENAIRITAGSQKAMVGIANPVEVDLGLAAELREGMLFAPPRPVIEAVGGAVDWDAVRNALLIFSPESLEEPDDDLEAEG
ncbi:MAG TPA: hypothetical protein DGT21_03180 [Armatimonadetes bacterium]|jgi:parvulin-like peptidyl-prolyl isomerase|nr:hypothetical protein [Armatimonadota bacterium]